MTTETDSGSSRSAACSLSMASRSPRTATGRARPVHRRCGQSATRGCWPRSPGCSSIRTLGRGLYGAQKVTAQLARGGGVEGLPVSRRQAERQYENCWSARGVRGRKFRTTRSARSGHVPRPADLVSRTPPPQHRTGCGGWTSPTCRPRTCHVQLGPLIQHRPPAQQPRGTPHRSRSRKATTLSTTRDGDCPLATEFSRNYRLTLWPRPLPTRWPPRYSIAAIDLRRFVSPWPDLEQG